MPKHDFLTPKAIANRIKSKGLQKLRWYCQMCQKQCRDENGFKCHLMSESHQRQMMLVADDPTKYLDAFSEEFLSDFMDLLRRRFGTKRVHNNQVYNEYIQFKEHIHMNSTKWVTLTAFTKWLGREGLCHVDETPKGWFISYIDRDAETLRKQEALKAKEKMDYTDEERNRQFIERQMAIDGSSSGSKCEATELKRDNEEETITLKLKPSSSSGPDSSKLVVSDNPLDTRSDSKKSFKLKSKPKTALQELMEEGLRAKKMKQEQEAVKESEDNEKWMSKGLIVKIITKRLGDNYYKQKAKVREMVTDYVAMVELINEPETRIKLDVIHVETKP
ncbi:DNA/RNA-binding protein KIN17-like [Convolutriloba macropyga]|uniref:DNA/RNA-binding protein KIN17-like n=1 Tax=Convolutriloba macropyga TaxID=536237 RepID=UPI003F520E19